METDSDPAGNRQRPRTSQACQSCRSLKARCLPSNENGKCQRCISSKRQCTWPESQQRPKRARTSRTRTAQIEQKLDGLVALLANSDSKRDSPNPMNLARIPFTASQSPTYTGIKEPLLSSQRDPYTQSLVSENVHHDFSPNHAHDTASISSEQSGNHLHDFQKPLSQEHAKPRIMENAETSSYHAIADDLIDIVRAEKLFAVYRKMSAFFPFVVIPPNVAVQEIRRRKPILFLAIMMNASIDDRPLQIVMEECFRQELATKVIVQYHRSLDCLQGILVYLAWYHFHFTTQTQQIYVLLQMAIGMAAELGISHRPRKPVIDISANKDVKLITPEVAREAQRAFLGCYYLSSCFAAGLSKPSMLPHTDYMDECCKGLALEREFSTDSSIAEMISLTCIGDEIRASFATDNYDEFCIEHMRVQILLKALRRNLKDWQDQYSDDGKGRHDSGTSQPRSHATMCHKATTDIALKYHEMELHLIGLRAQPRIAIDDHPISTSVNEMTRLNTLITCFEAGMYFLDMIIKTPIEHYCLFSFVEWMRLPYVLLKVCSFCFPSELFARVGWDVYSARERLRVDLYLGSLCDRLQSLTTFDPPTRPKPDFFCSIKVIMEKTQQWYLRKTGLWNDESKPAEEAEESPLEVLRDPHEPAQTSAVHSPEDQLDGAANQVKVGTVDPQDHSEVMYSTIAGLSTSSDLFNDFDDAFWTSNFFNTEMFSEA